MFLSMVIENKNKVESYMSRKVSELKEWLNSIDDNKSIYFVDLDGVWTLQIFENKDDFFVVGGGQELGVDENQE